MKSEASSLIFSWRKPPTTLAVLGSFLVLSTLIHAMGFYVFHVVYQPAVSLPPSPAQIMIVDPASPASAPFLAWLDSEDPALPFQPDPITPDLRALSPRYQSSISLFDTDRLAPLGTLAVPEESLPSVVRLIPQPIIKAPRGKRGASRPVEFFPPRPAQAIVRFDSLEPLAPVTLSSEEPNAAPAEFTMGIDRAGHVLFLISERTTGSDSLDKLVADQLRSATFPGDTGRPEIVWERARISWLLPREGSR